MKNEPVLVNDEDSKNEKREEEKKSGFYEHLFDKVKKTRKLKPYKGVKNRKPDRRGGNS